VRGELCATGFGDFDLVIEKSAPSRITVKFTVPVLLLPSGSWVEAEIDAELLVASPAGGTTTSFGAVAVTVMSSVAPTGSEARVQLTPRVG
jgi:hypothetical protein